MLQRSIHASPVDVPAIPATVWPGEVVDWPDPIAGFEPAPDAPPPSPEPIPSSKRKAAVAAPTGEESVQ